MTTMIPDPAILQRLARMSSADRLAALTKRRDELHGEIANARAEAAESAADGHLNEVARDLHAELVQDLAEIQDAILVIEKRIEQERLAVLEVERLERDAERIRLLQKRIEIAARLDAHFAKGGELWREFEATLVSHADRNRERLYGLGLLGRSCVELVRACKIPGAQSRFGRSSLVSLVSGNFDNATGGDPVEARRIRAEEKLVAEAAELAQVAELESQADADGLIESYPVEES